MLTLQQLFFKLWGREPHADELLQPYYIAELRRFGARDALFSEEQIKTSSTFMRFPKIFDEEGRLYYGGAQGWFAQDTIPPHRSIEQLCGCGAVSAANTLAVFAYGDEALARRFGLQFQLDGSLTQSNFLSFMRAVYSEMGTLEIPFYAGRYRLGKYLYEEKLSVVRDRRKEGKKKCGPMPPSLGVLGNRYIRGVRRMAQKKGLTLTEHVLSTMFVGYEAGLHFIKEGICSGTPVNILTTMNDHKMITFRQEYGKNGQEKTNARHHVTAVAVCEASEDVQIVVSTWGQLASISYKALFASWQSEKALFSSMCYFTPDKGKKDGKKAAKKYRQSQRLSWQRLFFSKRREQGSIFNG